MCTQILFGEHFEIVEEIAKWSRIRLFHDQYEGWIDKKMITPIRKREFQYLCNHVQPTTNEIFNIVQQIDHYQNFLIVSGSTLPHFKLKSSRFRIADVDYKLIRKQTADKNETDTRQKVIGAALRYFNSPYLWGGRTPLGIDCSGFTQIAYKIAGIQIPRDASEQAKIGEHLSFVEEALPGDLAFFDNENGEIVHVGIIWEKNKIIHSSGKVRIDNIDHAGIYNLDTHRYTHQMRLMKRII